MFQNSTSNFDFHCAAHLHAFASPPSCACNRQWSSKIHIAENLYAEAKFPFVTVVTNSDGRDRAPPILGAATSLLCAFDPGFPGNRDVFYATGDCARMFTSAQRHGGPEEKSIRLQRVRSAASRPNRARRIPERVPGRFSSRLCRSRREQAMDGLLGSDGAVSARRGRHVL